jgi:hypothetical protein
MSDPINPMRTITREQDDCTTNIFVLGWLLSNMGISWEDYFERIHTMAWELECAWKAGCEASRNNEDTMHPGPFGEFAREWLTVRLVTDRIES